MIEYHDGDLCRCAECLKERRLTEWPPEVIRAFNSVVLRLNRPDSLERLIGQIAEIRALCDHGPQPGFETGYIRVSDVLAIIDGDGAAT